MRQVEGHKEPGQKVTKALGVTDVEKESRPHGQSVKCACRYDHKDKQAQRS